MNRSDFLEDPSEEKGAELPVPVSNPALRFEMADLLGEVRWPVSYPEREEKIAAKKNAVLNELVKSKLLVPVKYNGDLNVGQNSLSAEQGQGLILPRITNKQKKAFLPLFTDWMEFEKLISAMTGAVLYFPWLMPSAQPVVITSLSTSG